MHPIATGMIAIITQCAQVPHNERAEGRTGKGMREPRWERRRHVSGARRAGRRRERILSDPPCASRCAPLE
jgi:hypothetical protein